MRTRVVRIIGQVDEGQALDVLTRGLNDEDPAVRSTAARGLTEQGRPPALEVASKCLDDRDWRVRCQGCKLLENNPEAALDKLLGAAQDPTARVRAQAVRALQSSAEPRVRQAIERALYDRAKSVRSAAVKAVLNQHAEPYLAGLLHAMTLDNRSELVAPIVELGAAAIEPLIEALGGEVDENNLVERCLIQIGGAAMPLLVKTLDAVAEPVQERIVRVLGHIGTKLALNKIARLVDTTRSSPLRQAAVEALGRIGSARTASTLARALEDRSAEVRHAALQALKRIDHPDAASALIRALHYEFRPDRIMNNLSKMGPSVIHRNAR